eukprot:Gb_10747 [translate_table: standard]
MPPQVQQKVKPIKPESHVERIARWTKEQEQAERRLPRTMAAELTHKYTHRTGKHKPRKLGRSLQPDIQNSKGEKSETSRKTPKEQIPSDQNRAKNSNIEGHEEPSPKIVDSDRACTWKTLEPSVRGGTMVFEIQTQTMKKLFAKLRKQLQEDSIKNTTRQVEERLFGDEASTDTQPTTDLATNMKNDFSKLLQN